MGRKMVALGGPRGCGKSSIADNLVRYHGFEKIAFSDVLREIAALAGENILIIDIICHNLGKN